MFRIYARAEVGVWPTVLEMKRWKEDIKGIGPLDYFVFKSVPMRESAWGPVIEVKEQILEHLALKAIVIHRVPIRGLEVKFIRKALGLTIQGWEKTPTARLLPTNEIAVRVLIAEEIRVEVLAYFSELIGTDSTPKKIELLAS